MIPSVLRNRLIDEIATGDRASLERTLTAQDIQLYAILSGDESASLHGPDRDRFGRTSGDGASDGATLAGAAGDPRLVEPSIAASPRFHSVISHGMWAGALFSGLIGTRLPGPGSAWVEQSLRFLAPVSVGDTLTIVVEVTAVDRASRRVRLSCRATRQDGAAVIEGEAEVIAPNERIEFSRTALPEVRLSAGRGGLQRLLDHVSTLAAIPVAVVHPCDATSLAAALDARAAGLIEPVLVAPQARLRAVAEAAGIDLTGVRIVDAAHSHAAAAQAVALAARGEVEALMKGSLHTDELLSALVARAGGLRTKRRVSHCFLMQTPSYPRPFIITDAAINIAPDLAVKADIVRNAIDLAHVIGVERPRVAILAAVETVSASMPATLDAAALCKMADRGQIRGAVLDGPLAFDNAVSPAAARIKGIDSPVAGQADVLVVPDLESGNMLAKQLEHMGDAASAGIALGAKVPVILTSRADSREARIASCAIALMLAHRYREAPP